LIGAERRTAPVLLWLHGGGFTSGSKVSAGSPAGLIARSKLDDEGGVIVISINYRLGLFGWLAGDDVTANLGLYDQLQALKWVEQYISLFGGSPDKVTVMGESAGASSIVHHVTAFGGDNPLAFQSAIIQSPAFEFNIDLDATYLQTMTEASSQTGETISTVDELKELNSEQLKSINQAVTLDAAIGHFHYGPGRDGAYVPDYPQALLLQGKFNSNLKVDMPIVSY
jgi:carboxylesterase type B